MVVELLLKPDARNWNFFLVILVGALYAIVGSLLASWLFAPYLGLVMVFFTVLAAAPFMYQMIQFEEKQELSFHTEKQFIKEYAHILKALLALFIGMTIGFLFFIFAYNAIQADNQVNIEVFVSSYENQNISPGDLADNALIYTLESSSSPGAFDYTYFKGDREKPIRLMNQDRTQEGYWWQSSNVIVSIKYPKKTQERITDLVTAKFLSLYPPTQAQYHDVDNMADANVYFFDEANPSDFFSVTDENNIINHKEYTYETKNTVLEAQLRFIPLDLTAKGQSVGYFMGILNNNLSVGLISFVLAFLFGFGALFILAWNASYLATAIAGFFSSTVIYHTPLLAAVISFLRFFTHGVFEIAAFFLMGLAGSIISFGITNHEYGTKKFLRTVADSAQLFLFAIILVIIAAFIEVWITPVFFG